jgi:hypothetical protein
MSETDDGGTYEVIIDENGNVWAGDELVVIEGEKASLTTPPAGITKGPPAPMKDGVYQFSAGSTGQGGPSTFGTATFTETGGDIGKITQILNGIKDIDWGSLGGKLKKVGSFLLKNTDTLVAGAALVSSYLEDNVQEKYLIQQAKAAADMAQAWKEDREAMRPAKESLYAALQDRMGQGAPPALMPGKVAYANPYQNVVKIGRGAEGSGSPESGPGATLGDAIRSEFTDRHPNAPPQQFIQQHPDRFARPGGPSTWEGQGGPPPVDQTGRIGTESSDPYNAQGGASQDGGIPYSDAQERERSIWERRNNPRARGTPIATPRPPRDPSLDVMESQGRHQQWRDLPTDIGSGRPRDKNRGSLFGDGVTAHPLEEVVPFDFGTPGKVVANETGGALFDREAQMNEALRVRDSKTQPEPTAEEWQMLLEYPELMDIYKSTGRVVGR